MTELPGRRSGGADLHVHTTASDGTWSPREVVEAAAGRGLEAIAITDHDAVAGVDPATAAGEELGVEVIPGIELGAELGGQDVHILGYFVRHRDECLSSGLEWLVEGRHRRMGEMLSKLQRLGIGIPVERVYEEAAGGVPTRAHLARVMVHMKQVPSVEEAFARYLDRGKPAYASRPRLTPVEAVRLVRQSGGCPVLAHPGLLDDDSFIPGLLPEGLVGIEVWYPEHDPGEVCRYLRLARDLDLIPTGGSDCHGPRSGHPIRLGTVVVGREVVDALREKKGLVERSADLGSVRGRII